MNHAEELKIDDVKSSLLGILDELTDESVTVDQLKKMISDGTSISDLSEFNDIDLEKLTEFIEDEFNISFINEGIITEDMSIYSLIDLIKDNLPTATTHKLV